jgi:hypothetical protein
VEQNRAAGQNPPRVVAPREEEEKTTRQENGYFYRKANIHFLSYLVQIPLRMRNVSDKNHRETQNTHFIFNNFFSKNVPFKRKCGNIFYSRTGHTWQYDTHALHAGYIKLQTHAQNM